MQINLKVITVVDKDDPETNLYKLAEQAIVLIWERHGYTMCKDVLGNTWLVINPEK